MLVKITSTCALKVREMEEVMNFAQCAAEEATVILSSVFDETTGDELRVTVVATGLGAPCIASIVNNHMEGFEREEAFKTLFRHICEFHPNLKFP